MGKKELRLVNSRLGEWAGIWNIVSEPGAPIPAARREMAEWPIRTATLKPLYASRTDDELNFQGVSEREACWQFLIACVSFLALCVTFNSP